MNYCFVSKNSYIFAQKISKFGEIGPKLAIFRGNEVGWRNGDNKMIFLVH